MPHLTRHVPQRLDADTPTPEVGLNTAREMRNVRVSQEGRLVVNGTVPVLGSPAAGTTVVVGKATDPATNTVYVFRFAANGQHTISAYVPDAGNEAVVLTWPGLGFTANTMVRAWVLDGILNWLDGVSTARALPLANAALYQSAITSSPATDFLTLNRLPPLLPLGAVSFYNGALSGNRLLDSSLQYAYLYEYVDAQRSVLSPWSVLVPMRHISPPATVFDNSILLTVPTGAGRPNALVKAVHFYVRKGNDGTAYRFFTEDNPAQYAPGDTWTVTTTYDTLNEALSSADAARPSDALPTGPPQAGNAIKNRNFFANFTDGYAAPAGLSLAVTAVVEAVGSGARAWRPRETEKLVLVAYDAFGRNIGVLPDTMASITIPSFDYSATVASCVTRLDCVITATEPLPSWVARIDVVRTDKSEAVFFTEGVGRLVFYYKDAFADVGLSLPSGVDGSNLYLDSPLVLKTAGYGGTNTAGYDYRVLVPDAIFLDVGNLPIRLRGYTYSPGDRADITYRNPRNTGAPVKTIAGVAVTGQDANLVKLDLSVALVLDYAILPTADAGNVNTALNGYTLRPFGTYTGYNGDDIFVTSIEHAPLADGVVFSVYTPGTTTGEYVEVAASVATPAGFTGATVSLQGNVWLMPGEQTPLRYGQFLNYAPGGGDFWYFYLSNYHTGSPDQNQSNLRGNNWKWLFNTSPSDLYPAWETDRGRVQRDIGPRLRQVRTLETGIIFSGKIRPETGINELNVFEATAIDVLPVEYGAVTVLVPASDAQERGAVLLALHTHQAESLSIEEAIIRSNQGEAVTTATSDQVIAAKSLLAGGYGCQDPLAFVERGGRVYYWCGEKGEFVRYAQNGLTPLGITYQLRTVLRRWQQAAMRGGLDGRIAVGYDGFAGEALLTLPRVVPADDSVTPLTPALTVAFSERGADGRGGFTSYYDFTPESIIGLPDGMTTAWRGQLHRHHGGAPASFYGVTYPAIVRFGVPEQQPATPVLWQQVVTESNTPWVPVLLTNERGQRTTILRKWWRLDRDTWAAAIRADGGADLRLNKVLLGQPMRSRTLEVTLSLANAEMVGASRLDAVEMRGTLDTTPLQQ